MTKTDTPRTHTTVGGESYSVLALARMADCADPDSLESAGSAFLLGVADGAAEVVDRYREDRTPEDRWDYSGEIHEVADGAIDIYTHTMWSEFVDLCAYREDPTDLGFDGSDMEQGARICLFMIAERLAWELIRAAGPFDEDEDTDSGEDEA